MNNEYKTATITKVEKETKKIKNFYLDASVNAKPGQYVMVWLPRLNEKPFGLLSASPISLSIANVGPFSNAVHQLKKGDKMTFRGPYGTSFTIKGKKILMVGGGYGVVPLCYMVETMLKTERKNVTFIVGARTKSDLPFIKRLYDLGCRVEMSTDNGSQGFKGYTPQLAAILMEKEKFDSVYSVGPHIMMEKVAELASKHKLFCQVSVETFFKCGGMGICGECGMNGKLVCTEGPVVPGKFLLKSASNH